MCATGLQPDNFSTAAAKSTNSRKAYTMANKAGDNEKNQVGSMCLFYGYLKLITAIDLDDVLIFWSNAADRDKLN